MMDQDLVSIVLGIVMGFTARFYMLRVDYRQYPNYPHEYVIHLAMGLVASALGSVAIPALVSRDFVAVTFLAIGTQQFREIRNMERHTLEKLESTELIPRGTAYIEGIAKVFEARNYLAMLVALYVSGMLRILPLKSVAGKLPIALGTSLFLIYVLNRSVTGQRLGDICIVREAEFTFKNSLLCVENVVLMNTGIRESRQRYLDEGLAVVLEPKDDDARATLSSPGQRQAIIHDVSIMLGVKIDISERDLTPLARLDLDTGKVILVVVPMEKDIECLLEAIRLVPVLESSTKKPLKSAPGRCASD
jgi:hypothetical protein